MKNYHQKKKNQAKDIALERIEELFKQAELTKNRTLANRYVKIARDISSRLKIRIPKDLKRKFCKHCGSYLRLGTTVRIRLNKGKKSYYCTFCHKFTRIPYK